MSIVRDLVPLGAVAALGYMAIKYMKGMFPGGGLGGMGDINLTLPSIAPPNITIAGETYSGQEGLEVRESRYDQAKANFNKPASDPQSWWNPKNFMRFGSDYWKEDVPAQVVPDHHGGNYDIISSGGASGLISDFQRKVYLPNVIPTVKSSSGGNDYTKLSTSEGFKSSQKDYDSGTKYTRKSGKWTISGP